MEQFTMYKFNDKESESELVEISSYINKISSFKRGKMKCFEKLVDLSPESFVLGLVYFDNGKYDIEVGVGGKITQTESKVGSHGFDIACARELAEELHFSFKNVLNEVAKLRIATEDGGASYIVPASSLAQIRSLVVPSPNRLDDFKKRRIDNYIYGTREEIESIAKNARTIEPGIVGYTVLKLSDLKPDGYSPSKDIELSILKPKPELEFLNDYGEIPEMTNEKKLAFIDEYWNIPNNVASGERIKMVEFIDSTGTHNLLLNKFLKKIDPKSVTTIRYYEA